MALYKNIPLIVILLPLMLAPISALVKPRAARNILLTASFICAILACALAFMLGDEAYAIKMGEVGAPFGNELYVSQTEAAVALIMQLVFVLSILGGLHRLPVEIVESRLSLFCTVCLLLLSAVNALTFTNDLFTGYVFLEITTIAAAALIFLRSREGALFASMRYMLMNLLGSGLFLLGLAVFYCLTGELLFPQLKEGAARVVQEGRYMRPFTVALVLMTLGLAIKSALYPFHTWLPNAYAGATPAASSLLSSLISKAYIFLFIKLIMRGAGAEPFMKSGVGDVLCVYACLAIIMGSVDAIREHNVRRMISYSSVAQIGYVFLGASLGTRAGMAAAVFHMLAHSAAKAMLFPAADRLAEVSGGNENYRDLRGSGVRAPLAGLAFTVGAFSITGLPFLGGFSSKVFLAQAAVGAGGWRMIASLAVITLSTALNVVYFLRTVLTLYRPGERYPLARDKAVYPAFACAMIVFICVNAFMGVCANTVMSLIQGGIDIW